eukprot:3473745-Rhodomonas_salina.2
MQKLAGQGENLNGCDDLTRPIPTMRGAISAPQLQPCNRAGLRSALQGKGSGGRWGRVKLEGAAFGSRYSFILFVTGKAFEQYCSTNLSSTTKRLIEPQNHRITVMACSKCAGRYVRQCWRMKAVRG